MHFEDCKKLHEGVYSGKEMLYMVEVSYPSRFLVLCSLGLTNWWLGKF